MLGLPPADDEDSLEQALEEEMDHFFDTFPQVGMAPEDIEWFGHAGFVGVSFGCSSEFWFL